MRRTVSTAKKRRICSSQSPLPAGQRRLSSSEIDNGPPLPPTSSINSVAQVNQILDSGKRINSELYVHLLRICSSEKVLAVGKKVHAHIMEARLSNSIYICNSLVNMYGKCGSLEAAWDVFRQMKERTVISWTSIMTASAQNKRYPEAVRVYRYMLQDGTAPNRAAAITAMQACVNGALLRDGEAVAEQVLESGYCIDAVVGTTVVTMLGKCGRLKKARLVFDEIIDKTVVTWTAMITCYANCGFLEQAFSLFQQMQLENVAPNEVTYLAVLNALGENAESLAYGKQLHQEAQKSGLCSDLLLGTAIVNMYRRCGCLVQAKQAFDSLVEKDVVAWNTIIIGYAELGTYSESFKMFRQMLLEGLTPTKATFVGLLNACSGPSALAEGRIIHGYVCQELETDAVLATAVFTMYGKCGALEEAEGIFSRLALKNLVSWNAMLALYADHDRHDEAFQMYRRLQAEGVRPDGITFMSLLSTCASLEAVDHGNLIRQHAAQSGFQADVAVSNAILDMYGKCSSLEPAQEFFDSMETRNVISWTSLITAYLQHGQDKQVLKLFHQMQLEAGVRPDRVTFAAVLNACASLPSLKDGRAVHQCMVDDGTVRVEAALANSLVNMYGKCGSLVEARAVLDELCTPAADASLWNSLMTAYAHQGECNEVLSLFRTMQQEDVRPDAGSFMAVLLACKHAGFLEDGLCCYASIVEDYAMVPTAEQLGCVIDLIARSGQLEQAEKYIAAVHQPAASVWTSLLDACKVHGDVERARRAGDSCIDEMDQSADAGAYVTLFNVFTQA